MREQEGEEGNIQVKNKKGKGREGAGCGVRWSRQMVGGCVSNQPGDMGESSDTKSREILTVKSHTGEPKG